MTIAWIDLGTDAVVMHVWFWITALLPLVWLKRHIDISRGRDEPILSDAEARPLDDEPPLPPLSMLVAGKDEEANIGACIEGLLRQRHPALQIIAVNDRSGDRTGEILDAFAAADPRVTALHVRELPAGWFGKNNAMRSGVTAARADWLAFTDADCQFHSPHLLEAAMRFAMRNGVEFLSVLPRIDAGSFWERVVQPAASGMMLFWNPPHRVNSPKSSCAYANGAFMLMSRDAYQRLGGHEAVKATLNEDMHFARRAKQVGVRLRVIRGGDLFSVRMYTGLGQIWRGWSRIFYGSFGTFPRLLASALVLVVASMSPYLTLIASPLTGSAAGPIGIAALAAIAAQQSVLWRFYPICGVRAPWAMTYPIGTTLVTAMVLNAMTKLGGLTKTSWRGTVYRGGS